MDTPIRVSYLLFLDWKSEVSECKDTTVLQVNI